MRLLFSSAQVEYIRYWLHAMQLTKEPIPLPSSEYLIRSADLKNCSPNVYRDATVLKRAIKVRSGRARSRRRRTRRCKRARACRHREAHADVTWALVPAALLQNIDKDNKRSRGSDPKLARRRVVFERVRTLWAAKIGTWCAVDFEAWDRDHTVLTEFGWRLIRWEDQQPVEEHGHLVVKEHRIYSQNYVPDYRNVSTHAKLMICVPR